MDDSSDQDLLTLEPPTGNQRDRIVFLARALAYGVISDAWSPYISVTPTYKANAPDEEGYYSQSYAGEYWGCPGDPTYEQRLQAYLTAHWNGLQPQAAFFEAMGYFEQKTDVQAATQARAQTTTYYLLTSKAFDLLEEPTKPPSVFISYSRRKSSAFGLLIVARLQAKGMPNPFLDLMIEPGEEWHSHLEKIIQSSEYFVCLIADGTLDSPHVQDEIQWAEKAGLTIIPVWQPDFTGTGNFPESVERIVKSKNAIRVTEESAEGYNSAVVRLLNRLGYAP
jgi:hypothetical protein